MPTTSALVIGGSLAGMCAARVLSDFVDKVTVIERDAYPSAPEFRSGVPQARHVHNLLARGLREFESFFPGFEARMRERGAVSVESGLDTATLWPHVTQLVQQPRVFYGDYAKMMGSTLTENRSSIAATSHLTKGDETPPTLVP